MALIVVLRNISGLAPVSDYEYQILVNEVEIAAGTVHNHLRAEGWKALLRKLVEQAED